MTTPSKGRKIAYWITTGIVALGTAFSGVMSLINPPELAVVYETLGYPLYLAVLIGVAKLLAALTLVVPRFPRLKEWAYAGLVIDMIGAFYSHVMVSDPAQSIASPLVFLTLTMASYFLRPDNRRLPDLPPTV
jgi:hypothetical protein